MRFYNQLINESLPGAAQAVPATTTVPSAEYPRVYADGRVIFEFIYPPRNPFTWKAVKVCARHPFQ